MTAKDEPRASEAVETAEEFLKNLRHQPSSVREEISLVHARDRAVAARELRRALKLLTNRIEEFDSEGTTYFALCAVADEIEEWIAALERSGGTDAG